MKYTNGEKYYCELVDSLLTCTTYYEYKGDSFYCEMVGDELMCMAFHKYKKNGFKLVNAIPYGEIYEEQ